MAEDKTLESQPRSTWRQFRRRLLFAVGVAGALGLPNTIYSHLTEPILNWLWRTMSSLSLLLWKSHVDALFQAVASTSIGAEPALTPIDAWLPLAFCVIQAMTAYSLARSVLRNRSFLRDRAYKNATTRTVAAIAMLFMVLTACGELRDLVDSAFIKSASRHYAQIRHIVAPDVEPHQLLVFDSRFASMTTKQEYDALMREMADICKAPNRKIPDASLY